MTLDQIKAHLLDQMGQVWSSAPDPTPEELKTMQDLITLFCDKLQVPEGVHLHTMAYPVVRIEFKGWAEVVLAVGLRARYLTDLEELSEYLATSVKLEMQYDLSKLRALSNPVKGWSYHYCFYRFEHWRPNCWVLRKGTHVFTRA